MSQPILSRDQVAEHFSVAPSVLQRYEAFGLVRAIHDGDLEGYGAAEIRRAWTILSLQRDLGINLAGVEAVLKLRVYLDGLHRQIRALAAELEAVVNAEGEGEADE
jgi:MerR family transcriptional regulator, heat shock protein HspR